MNSSNFERKTTSNGSSIGINTSDQVVFTGKMYFTLDRNLYMLDGSRQIRQLTSGIDVRDPVVSPNGKLVAFVVRRQNYSDLVYMPTTGGPLHTLRSGAGKYINNPGYPAPRSTYQWYAQPAWITNTQLLFLSDLEKDTWGASVIGANAFLLDMQIFSLSIDNPTHIQEVAFASYGDGGDRDPSYRPGSNHPPEIVYTHYAYDQTQTQQVIQIFMTDPNAIMNHPEKHYHPGIFETGPFVPLTPSTPNLENLQPSFSPDGNYIAYVRRQDATYMGLYIMPVAENVSVDVGNAPPTTAALAPYQQGSSLILTQQYVSQPIWSSDGKQLAYITYTNNTFDIWLVNVALDPKTGLYKSVDSSVQLTDASGHLDADSRPFWIR